MRQQCQGLTLIEVIVVLAIVAVLAALTFPALQRSQEQSKIIVTQSRLKNIGVALILYRENLGAKDTGTPSEMGSPYMGLPPRDLPTTLKLSREVFECASPKPSAVSPVPNGRAYKCMSCPTDSEFDNQNAVSWARLSQTYSTQLPFVVMMCHSDPRTDRHSPYSTHLGLGVNFEGQLIRKQATGTWGRPEWWVTGAESQ